MKTNIGSSSEINLICLLGAFLMILIPYTVQTQALLIVSICGIGILIGEMFFKKHFYLLYIAPMLCVPSGLAMYDLDLSGIAALNKGIRMWEFYPLILLALFKILKIKDNTISKYINFIVVPCILVSIMQYLITDSENEYMRLYPMLATGVCIMIMVYYDKKLTFLDFYKYISVLFFISSVYVLLQYIHISPYNFVTEMTSGNAGVNRLSGLLGHPLFLAFFVSFFQTMVYIRLLLYKKINVLHVCICLIIGFLTVSRVFILSLLVVSFMYLILSGKIKSFKAILGMIIVFCLSYYALTEFDVGLFSDFKSRFENGDTNHRLGTYEIAFFLLGQNILGSGYSNVMQTVYSTRMNTNMLIADFATVDNLFLTSFIAYGILSVFFILYYYYPLVWTWKFRNRNKMIFKSMLLLFVNVFIYSCTLDWESSIVVSVLVFSLSGLLLRLFNSQNELYNN